MVLETVEYDVAVAVVVAVVVVTVPSVEEAPMK